MKTKIRKTIIVVLIAVCCGVCLALGMANIGDDGTRALADSSDISTLASSVTTSDGLVLTTNDDGGYTVTGYSGKITSAVIPDTYSGVNVTEVGESAFEDCTTLKTLTIGKNVTKLGNSAFSGCTALTEINFNATEMKARGLSEGNKAFYKAGQSGSGITVTIGANVTRIPAYLFWPTDSLSRNSSVCPNITSLVFESGSVCTTIYTHAFACVKTLESVVIPDSVTGIDSYSFYACGSLKSLTIGKSVETIGSYAFYYCDALEDVYYRATAADDLKYNNQTFYYAGYSSGGITLTVSANVTRIPAYLFYPYSSYSSSDLRHDVDYIIFESGSVCESIGSYAFYSCGISSVNFPDSLTKIGSYAFYNSGFGGQRDLVLPCNLTSIGSYAFDYCSMYTLVIPDSVTSIGGHAFYRCRYITTLTIGAGVKTIGDSAFEGCASLTEIYFNAVAMDDLSASSHEIFSGSSLTGSSPARTIVFGDKVTRIPAYLFYYSSSSSWSCNVKYVTIGESVTEIGEKAFCVYNSRTFSSVVFKSPGGWTLSDGTNISSDSLSDPETAAEILDDYRNYAWYKSIWEFSLSSDGTYYVISGYYGSSSSVTIADTYDSLPVKEIAPSVFEGHTEITSVTIPENITTIGDYAFSGCTYVTKIYFNATAMNDLESNNGVFYNTGKKGSGITVTIGANVTRIPAYFLCPYTVSNSYVPNVKTVTFQSGSECTEIGDYAFIYCHFSEFSIPSGVTCIGTGAFSSTNITSVTIPSAVKTVGSEAFSGCSYLEEVYFNATAMDDLETDNMMFWCDYSSSSKVTITVTIGANVTRIPANLFATSVISILGIEIVCEPRVTTVIFESGSQCTEIGANAFYTEYISELYVDDLASYLSIDFAGIFANPLFVVSLNGGAFYVDGSKTTELTARNTSGVTRIGSYALAYCTIITDVALGEDVAYIGAHAFEGMSGLKSFTLSYYSGWTVYASSTLSSGTKITSDELEGNALTYFTSTYVSYVWRWTYVSNAAPVVECKEVASGGYINCSFTVMVSVDASSSVWYIAYTDPTGATFTSYYDATWTITPAVNGTYEFVAVDTDGFVSETYYIIFDDTAPDLYLGGAAAWANYNSSEFSVLAVDNLDENVRLYYSLDGENGEWILCGSNPYTVTPDSKASTDGYWWFKAVDAAGNSTPAYRTVLDTVAVFGSWEFYDDMSLYFSYSAPSYTSWTCYVNGVEYSSGSPFDKDLTTYTAVLTSPNGSTLTAEKYLDHYFPEDGEVVDPTCRSMGYTIYTCVYCGETQLGNFLSACDHEYMEVTVEATCTTNGYSRAECIYCGGVKEGSYTPIYASGHSPVSGAYLAPTCTEPGYYGTVCEVCGAEIETTPIEALGHLLMTETVPSTCVSYGYSLTYCTRDGCDYSVRNGLSGTDAYLTDHVYGDVLRVSATCTDDGYTYEKCTVCGYEHTTVLHATGHDFGQYYEAEDTETGLVTRWHTCKTCGFTESFELSNNADTAANGVIDIFQKYQKYMWWILLAFVGIWSIFIGLRWALSRNGEEKAKAKSMLANYILGIFVIAIVLVGLPYLIYGIAILVG